MRVLMLTWEFPPRSVGGVAAHVDGLSQAMAAAGHDVVLLTLAHPGSPADTMSRRRARAAGPHRPAVAARRRPRRPRRLGQPPPRRSCRPASCRGARTSSTPTTGRSPGPPTRSPRSTTPRSSPRSTAPSAASTAAGSRPGEPEHDPRRRVVARPPRRRGARQLPVHGPRGRRRVRAAGRAHPPHPQRHRPDVVGDRRGARRPRRRSCSRGGACSTRRASRCSPGPMQPAAPARAADPSASSAAAAATSPSCSRRSTSRASATSSTSPASCPTTSSATTVHRAGCVVIPSLYEPFGIVALEALAGGAPLVVARTGGLAELIDGTGAGLLFEPGNAAELAACIELVLERRRPRRRDAQARRRAARRPLLVAGHRRRHGERLRRPPVRPLSQRARRIVGRPASPSGRRSGPLPSRPMRPVRRFEVTPAIPPPLAALPDLASNLHWAWDPEATRLFARIWPGLAAGVRPPGRDGPHDHPPTA